MTTFNVVDHNTRATEMWIQIIRSLWFSNQTVVDLGCGGGDFLWRCIHAGASNVLGIDADISLAKQYAKIYRRRTSEGKEDVLSVCDVLQADLNDAPDRTWEADIGLCLSVIPYLKEPISFLHWMKDNFSICILEIQYYGDGPGMENVRDATDMKFLLHDVIGFSDVDQIGYTMVKEGKFRRDLWRCLL